jgi:plasmid stability protein
MSELTIRNIDDATLAFLHRRAEALGESVERIAEELLKSLTRLSPPSPEEDVRISTEELRERRRIALEIDALRSRTLKPFSADSTLVIREMRDRR